uniref:Opsin n=1 Tax=Ditylenchus dipsaci TaxID=166011 RepID=A0A915D9F1_9BILA
MNVLIFHPQEFEFHYNCSGYSVESIPLEIRRHKFDAICLILIFLNLEIIYILCLYAISRPQNIKASSYKLMFCLGVAEMAGISITGLVSGIFNFLGVTYCSNPTINYFFGSAATGIWYFEAQISVVLAFNRCLSMTSTYSSRALFHGKKFYLWILIPLTIAFLMLWFTPPVVYSSVGAVGYAYESYFEEIPILVKITAYAYVIYQGSPAMVYLLLNKTIQKEIKLLLCLDTRSQKNCSTTDINASKHSQNFVK